MLTLENVQILHVYSNHSSFALSPSETEFPKVEAESSSFDEESSDAFSPEQILCQDSPLVHLPSPPEIPANETTPKQVPYHNFLI